MITKTRQNWNVGQTVKVGFMTLKVVAAVATPGDYAPDAYVLTNHAGTQLYSFVPHNGLEKISPIEAKAMLAAQEEAAARETFRALQQARDDAKRASEVLAVIA